MGWHIGTLAANGDGHFDLNDWSFAQLCKLANVSKDTVNRLSPTTASRVFAETLPTGTKPLQLLTTHDTVRAIHQASYTRLFNVDLLTMVREFATDFVPPQPANVEAKPADVSADDVPFDVDPEPVAPSQDGRSTGEPEATGLYCGEQDMFCFLIDPTGWAEIEGQAFAPGFFIWNSEVGRRSVGVQTFWFQAICQNHIVWDAVEVADFSRKHTANVHESLAEIRRRIEVLVEKRDQRRDGFVQVIRKAMATRLGDDADEVLKLLTKQGITNPKTGKLWSLLRWHWLRHYHRTRAHVSRIRREVSKLAMGHAADPIHDHYRGLDRYAFHEEYAKFDSGIDDALFAKNPT